jgi:transposase-like protein
VHKLRNLESKVPEHALAEIYDDFHRIVYAASGEAARTATHAFERKWAKRCVEALPWTPALVKLRWYRLATNVRPARA